LRREIGAQVDDLPARPHERRHCFHGNPVGEGEEYHIGEGGELFRRGIGVHEIGEARQDGIDIGYRDTFEAP